MQRLSVHSENVQNNDPSFMAKGNLIVAQGGGPTVAINNSLRGVIEQSLRESSIDGIYGAQYGLEGVVREDLVDLQAESRDTVEGLKYTPGAALCSSRAKLSEKDYHQVLETFEKYDVRYFLYIGGNGSMAACHRVHTLAADKNVDLRVLGVPKTIDNDIQHTDHCPGYGSACRYYAVTIEELGRDVESLPTPVSVFETMGRNTGWLAAATGLAKQSQMEAPHLIYVPEKPLDQEQFLNDVQKVYDELGWVVVAVSEGVVDEDNVPLSGSRTSATTDDFGREVPGDVGVRLAELVSQKLGLRARSEKPGLCGRASVVHASDVDLREAYEVGRTGVRSVVNGTCGAMIALQRKNGSKYDCTFECVDLAKVAGSERSLPTSFMNEKGNMVTPAFREYASPLLGEALPEYTRLTKHPVDDPEGRQRR